MIFIGEIIGNVKAIADKSVRHSIMSAANELSFKLLLAFFPFIMLCFSVLGFLHIESETFLAYIGDAVPEPLLDIARVFAFEVIDSRSIGLLSFSILIALFSASSGFHAVIRGVNKSYDISETRHLVTVRLLSVLLVFVFILSIASAIIFVFSKFISLLMLIFTTAVIYKVASCKKILFKNVLPGAILAVTCWAIATKLFSFYILNFANFSIYGSLGGIIILMIWINIISAAFLIGSEVNSMVE